MGLIRRHRTVFIGLAVVLILSMAVLLAASRTGREATVLASPTPTASLDPFNEQREQVSRLSRELGGKYFTYQRPDDPAYLESLKPYLEPGLYAETVRLNLKYGRLPGATSLRSTVDDVSVTDVSENEATSFTVLTSTEEERRFQQNLEVHWQKQGPTWVADRVIIKDSDKEPVGL